MTSATGSWNLTMSTPMGEQTAVLAITEESTATMTGTDGEVQTADAFKAEGDRLTWKIAVKKPIPLTLHFDVTVSGESLEGKFRPGMFPPSPVTGVRV